jgi:hypothetical protein
VILRDFQSLLSRIYGIDQCLDVYDFLVTDAAMLANLEKPHSIRDTEEKLLIHEHEDEMGVLLYLNSELLKRLTEKDPRRYLGQNNLADFCKVLEGISHFIYLAWNAAADKSVTLMEMEMQAEVDKYIGARVLLHQQPWSPLDDSLFGRLFDNPCFDDRLNREELTRYRHASSYAGRYCLSLEKRFPGDKAGVPCFDLEMIRDLRAFYRLPQRGKVSHIQSAVFA